MVGFFEESQFCGPARTFSAGDWRVGKSTFFGQNGTGAARAGLLGRRGRKSDMEYRLILINQPIMIASISIDDHDCDASIAS